MMIQEILRNIPGFLDAACIYSTVVLEYVVHKLVMLILKSIISLIMCNCAMLSFVSRGIRCFSCRIVECIEVFCSLFCGIIVCLLVSFSFL